MIWDFLAAIVDVNSHDVCIMQSHHMSWKLCWYCPSLIRYTVCTIW